MALAEIARPRRRGGLKSWLLGSHAAPMEGPHEREVHRPQPWWRVMCLTGVDYFSTLGYQPGIAALAAGVLSPVATLVLVAVTLFGALPVYRRVAMASPHGEGSIAMLARFLSWWQGKLFVLVLLGFAATDFIITITLSAADAAAHVSENPFTPGFLRGERIAITLFLVVLLGAIFLKGFGEAIGVAVVLVAVYLALNCVVIAAGLHHTLRHPALISDWRHDLFAQHGNPVFMVAVALLIFPRLALGLSGFETGVAVMPLVQGKADDDPAQPQGRIRSTHRLLATAAAIMSVFLIASSFVTTVLIPHDQFEPGGAANGRALSYLAHAYLGSSFGTVYDVSTILILWFAGASAMAGLLNLVPRYLPRYGMAPDWASATRPLVLVFTAIAFVVTLLFRADVDKQGGAYATGVLVLMTSAAIAVALMVRREGSRRSLVAFVAIACIFVYTTIVNIFERPDGVKIATFFIGAIIITSLVSRVRRATELRVENVVLDETAQAYIDEMAAHDEMRLIANQPDARDIAEYFLKEKEQREDADIPPDDPILFLEVTVKDPSDFREELCVHGVEVGRYRVLRMESPAISNAIAALLLEIRDRTGKIPHVYFGWGEEGPLVYLGRYLLFGDGDIPPVTREVLREAEPDPERRPHVHVA